MRTLPRSKVRICPPAAAALLGALLLAPAMGGARTPMTLEDILLPTGAYRDAGAEEEILRIRPPLEEGVTETLRIHHSNDSIEEVYSLYERFFGPGEGNLQDLPEPPPGEASTAVQSLVFYEEKDFSAADSEGRYGARSGAWMKTSLATSRKPWSRKWIKSFRIQWVVAGDDGSLATMTVAARDDSFGLNLDLDLGSGSTRTKPFYRVRTVIETWAVTRKPPPPPDIETIPEEDGAPPAETP